MTKIPYGYYVIQAFEEKIKPEGAVKYSRSTLCFSEIMIKRFEKQTSDQLMIEPLSFWRHL